MDFIADQTIPTPSVEEIRALGNTVVQAEADSDDARGRLLERAAREDRILLTFEPDYYRRVFEPDAARPPGVVWFRLDWETPRDPAHLLAAVLTDDDLSVEGRFTLLETGRLRQKPIDESS